MNTKYKNYSWGMLGQIRFAWLVTTLFVFLQASAISANEKAIEAIEFSSLVGNKVQLQLKMDSQVVAPKIFQTDNPARIALDFVGVKSHLAKKSFPVNQGSASTVYVLEAGNRTRVVLNLVESVTYKTRIEGNDFYLVLDSGKSIAATEKDVKKQQKQTVVSRLIPRQTIKGIDFRRGKKGEGRLLLALSNPNTVVDVKERGGKVVLNFLNTRLPAELSKSYDVIDFATPVQRVDASSRGNGAVVTVSTVDGNYEYSSFQSEGLLTVEFRPISEQEKVALLKDKFPYTGDKLSLNFQNIEVRSVLQILADFTSLNIIASDSVGGSITLRLNDVPWDQALSLVLKSKGLSKREDGNVVYVAPATEITKMEEEELAAQAIEEKLEPLRTEYIEINYAKAEDIQALLTGQNVVKSSSSSNSSSRQGKTRLGGRFSTNSSSRQSTSSESDGLLSERGRSTVDSRTNTLIIKETAKNLEEIRKLISLLDVPIRQVMIESRIVIANTDFARNLGVKFGVAKTALDAGSGKFFSVNGAGQTVKTSNALNGTNPVLELPDNNALVDLAAAGIKGHPVGALGMTLARAADYVLNLELSALENSGGGEVLSNPRVMTVDRETAIIKQGVQIPFESGSLDQGTVTELVDAVLELSVTPQITPSGEVLMELLVKKDNPDNLGALVTIQKREVQTNVQVKDGETIVLGGIYEQQTADENFKVPFFGDLPGVGFLFKKKEISDTKTEMLIFVTPKIVKQSFSVN